MTSTNVQCRTALPEITGKAVINGKVILRQNSQHRITLPDFLLWYSLVMFLFNKVFKFFADIIFQFEFSTPDNWSEVIFLNGTFSREAHLAVIWLTFFWSWFLRRMLCKNWNTFLKNWKQTLLYYLNLSSAGMPMSLHVKTSFGM